MRYLLIFLSLFLLGCQATDDSLLHHEDVRDTTSFDGTTFTELEGLIANGAEQISVEAWVHPKQLPEGHQKLQYIVAADDGTSKDLDSVFALSVESNQDVTYMPKFFEGTNVIFGVRTTEYPSTPIVISNNPSWESYLPGLAIAQNRLKEGEWTYLVGTYDGTTTKLYVDGMLAATSDKQPDGKNRSISGALSSTQIPRRIGSDSHDPPKKLGFVGMIGDVKIHERALTDEEIVRSFRVKR